MTSPLRQLRETAGLTQAEMALLLDTSTAGYVEAERGRYPQLPPKLILKLEDAGYDGRELAAQYQQWREGLRQSILARTGAQGEANE